MQVDAENKKNVTLEEHSFTLFLSDIPNKFTSMIHTAAVCENIQQIILNLYAMGKSMEKVANKLMLLMAIKKLI